MLTTYAPTPLSSIGSLLPFNAPQVKQGFEPLVFSCHFLGWNPNLWAQNESYEAYRQQVTQGVTSVQEELKKYEEGRKFPYEQLKGKLCPTGVDPTVKEVCAWLPYINIAVTSGR